MLDACYLDIDELRFIYSNYSNDKQRTFRNILFSLTSAFLLEMISKTT